MKKTLVMAALVLISAGCFAQKANAKQVKNMEASAIEKVDLLKSDSTEFYLLSEDAEADERVIVNNYSSRDDSFILWSYAQGTWVLIAETSHLLSFEEARGNGTINRKYYRFRYKSEKDMETLSDFSKYLSCIAIYSLSGQKHRVLFQRQNWDLVVSIYDVDSQNGIPSTAKERLSYDYIRPLIGSPENQSEFPERLEKLKSYYEQGIITQDEYETQRKEIIKQM